MWKKKPSIFEFDVLIFHMSSTTFFFSFCFATSLTPLWYWPVVFLMHVMQFLQLHHLLHRSGPAAKACPLTVHSLTPSRIYSFKRTKPPDQKTLLVFLALSQVSFFQDKKSNHSSPDQPPRTNIFLFYIGYLLSKLWPRRWLWFFFSSALFFLKLPFLSPP